MTHTEYGHCPMCGRRTALRRGGQVRQHYAGRQAHHMGNAICGGSGLPCVEIAGEIHPLEQLALAKKATG